MNNLQSQSSVSEIEVDKEIEQFKQVVLKDVKNESTEEDRQYLLGNLEYWLYSLQTTRRDVEFQLSSQKSKDKISLQELKAQDASYSDILEHIKKQDKWKMGAIRFLSAIEKKMLYVKILIKNHTAE